jgi:hypothetical protein
MYDVIIIGGGIAGLYTALKLVKTRKILLLESSDKVGGRANNIVFENTCVVTGAGIGRKKKDIILQDLLSFFKFPINEFMSRHIVDPSIVDPSVDPSFAIDCFLMIRESYKKHPIHVTFKEFAISVIGKKNYQLFIEIVGFTDYENEDVERTLFSYGFEDNLTDWVGFSVPWSKLILKMKEYIGDCILVNSKVKQVYKKDKFYVKLNNGQEFISSKVVFATTIETVQKIIPHMYDCIRSQPFLRLYGKFDPDSSIIMDKHIKGMTIVKGPLQKIIKMNKSVYMISYSDNKNARKLYHYTQNNLKNRSYLARLLEKTLGLQHNKLKLTSILGIYWKIGTHYYRPVKKIDFYKLQRPVKDIFVVGEMVAENQGWVEGALKTVENVIDSL